MDLPNGRHRIMRTEAKRGLLACEAILGVVEKHSIVAGLRNGPGVVRIVRDRCLRLGHRRPPLPFPLEEKRLYEVRLRIVRAKRQGGIGHFFSAREITRRVIAPPSVRARKQRGRETCRSGYVLRVESNRALEHRDGVIPGGFIRAVKVP